MTYLLDTNICIYSINNRHPNLTNKLLTISPDDIAVSSITVGELEYGAAKSRWGDKTRQTMYAFLSNFNILPFDTADAICFGTLRAALAFAGTPIGSYDVMIAAQGLTKGLIVVTHNTEEFSRVPNLLLEDWVN